MLVGFKFCIEPTDWQYFCTVLWSSVCFCKFFSIGQLHFFKKIHCLCVHRSLFQCEKSDSKLCFYRRLCQAFVLILCNKFFLKFVVRLPVCLQWTWTLFISVATWILMPVLSINPMALRCVGSLLALWGSKKQGVYGIWGSSHVAGWLWPACAILRNLRGYF